MLAVAVLGNLYATAGFKAFTAIGKAFATGGGIRRSTCALTASSNRHTLTEKRPAVEAVVSRDALITEGLIEPLNNAGSHLIIGIKGLSHAILLAGLHDSTECGDVRGQDKPKLHGMLKGGDSRVFPA